MAKAPRKFPALAVLLTSALIMMASFSVQVAQAERYGPFDYYNPPKGSRSLVEVAHFGPRTMDHARRGDWCWYWSDLDYTLYAFPNHPRALEAMAEFLDHHQPCVKRDERGDLKEILAEIEDGGWEKRTADFYYEAAIKFRPKQATGHLLYGKYLYRKRRLNEALEQLLEADKLQSGSAAETQYYLGMTYADIGSYREAQARARKAYKLGAREQDLREKLVNAGVWKD